MYKKTTLAANPEILLVPTKI